MSFVGDIWDDLTGKSQANAAMQASAQQLGFQRDALDYLKQANAPALEAQKFGLQGLMDYYQNPQAFMDTVQQSPYFNYMQGQQEEALLRNAAATGGLRGGATQQALMQQAPNLAMQLAQQRLGGLGQLAGIGNGSANIANQLNAMGQTQAQGTVGAQTARSQGTQNLFNLGANALAFFSDERLKQDIRPMGEINGHKWYSWTWNSDAEKLGLVGSDEGVIAQEVAAYKPSAVSEKDGYLTVDYSEILNG